MSEVITWTCFEPIHYDTRTPQRSLCVELRIVERLDRAHRLGSVVCMLSKASTHEILIVEDDPQLATLLSEYLQLNGFPVRCEVTGRAAIERILSTPPTLVILDLMLPGMSGLEVCRALRPQFSGIIMMLTASQSELDHIAGLELGADDFVVKPIDPRVLLARIHTLLRRYPTDDQRTDSLRRDSSRPRQVSNLTLTPSTRTAEVGGEELELTSMEFDILAHLVLNAGSVVRREDIYPDVMGIEYDGLDRGLDVHISRIRRKLERAGFNTRLLRSVRGVGYLMEVT